MIISQGANKMANTVIIIEDTFNPIKKHKFIVHPSSKVRYQQLICDKPQRSAQSCNKNHGYRYYLSHFMEKQGLRTLRCIGENLNGKTVNASYKLKVD